MNRSTWMRSLIALSVLANSACGGEGEKKAAEKLEVSVVTVAPQEVTLYTDFIGTIDGIENADIRARVPGYLEAVHFQEGTQVRKGEILFTLDPVLSQAQVRQARGDLAMAQAATNKSKADVDRLTPLVATNSVSRQELDHAVAEKQSAEAQTVAAQGALASAQANLDFTSVRSPIDGIVGVRKVSIGTLVGQAEPTLLTTVSQLDPVRVRFPISEQLYLKHATALNRLVISTPPSVEKKPGEKAKKDAPEPTPVRSDRGRTLKLQLILADGSKYSEPGWLTLIDRAVSVSTGSILLEAQFPNPKGILRPGQFARVRAATAKVDQAIALPQRAIIERQSMHEVLVLGAGDKVERRAVTVGEQVGRYWLITKGLAPGERVLTEGVQKVRPGMIVQPKDVPLGDVSASSQGVDAPTPPSNSPPPDSPPPDSPPPSSPAPASPATDQSPPSKTKTPPQAGKAQ